MSKLYDLITKIIERVQRQEDISDLEREFNMELVRKSYPHIMTFSIVGFSFGFLLGRYFKLH